MTVAAAFGKLTRELAQLNDVLAGLRMTVVEDRPLRDASALVDWFGDAVDELAGWSAKGMAAAKKGREAMGTRVNGRIVSLSLAESQRSFHRVVRSYDELLSYEKIAALTELGQERRGEWDAWVAVVRQGLGTYREPLEAVGDAYLECWEELAERQEVE